MKPSSVEQEKKSNSPLARCCLIPHVKKQRASRAWTVSTPPPAQATGASNLLVSGVQTKRAAGVSQRARRPCPGSSPPATDTQAPARIISTNIWCVLLVHSLQRRTGVPAKPKLGWQSLRFQVLIPEHSTLTSCFKAYFMFCTLCFCSKIRLTSSVPETASCSGKSILFQKERFLLWWFELRSQVKLCLLFSWDMHWHQGYMT